MLRPYLAWESFIPIPNVLSKDDVKYRVYEIKFIARQIGLQFSKVVLL